MLTRPTPLFLFGRPKLRAVVTRGLRAVGVRLVNPGSGVLFAKDPVERVIYEVCEAAEEHGIEALSAAQSTVVHAWSAMGIISNGGFRYYFEGAWMIREVARAFRTLGFSDAANACDEAGDAFPAGVPPQDGKRRWAILETLAKDAFRHLDERLWAMTWDELRSAINAHMEKHPAEFRRFREDAG